MKNKREEGMIATNFLIIGFLLGMGTWQSMAIGGLLGFILIKHIL